MKIKDSFTYRSSYATYNDCQFMVGRYSNGNLGIEIWSDTEGPVTKVTVNPNVGITDDYISVKNWSENEGMDKFLINEGLIAESPVRTINSGFVMIPIYRLTDKGKEIFCSD